MRSLRLAIPAYREDPSPARRKLLKQALAGAAIVVALLGGIYGFATTMANDMAAGFATTQSATQSRRIEFEAETMRASAERMESVEKCSQGTRKERAICNAKSQGAAERAALRSMNHGETRPR